MAFNIDNLSLSLFINDKSNEELQETNTRFNSRYIEDVLDTLIQNRHYSEPINSIDTHIITDYTYVCNNNLSDIELNNTTFIGIGAFEYCENLISINDNSNNVITLSHSSFANCTNLRNINIQCNNLPDRCFYNCQNLTKINIYPNSDINTIGAECFYNCTELKNIDISNYNITSIGTMSFYGCLSLRRITFNSALTLIDAYAFTNCNLEKVVIPKNVKYIETSAFENNIGLQQVIFEHSEDDIIYINDNVFSKCPNVTIISHNSKVKEYAQRNKLKMR